MTTEDARAERDSALTAVAGALTEAERTRILDDIAPPGSELHGAHVDDLIEMADQTDSFVSVLDPFFAEHASELDLPGSQFAGIALCLMSAPLTALNVKKILLRAGLLPPAVTVLTWKTYSTPPMRAVTGYRADGEIDAYFVAYTGTGRVLLCRWRKDREAGDLEAMRQAVETMIESGTADEGRRLADRYEQGEDLEWAAAWCRPGKPAMRVS